MRGITEGLSPTLRLLYDLFSKHEGRVVRYADISKVYAGDGALRKNVQLLRAKLKNSPVQIDNVPRIGYRLRIRKKRMKMRHVEIDQQTMAYATELQSLLWQLSIKHESVTFSQQISMLGATIGMILLQISPENRIHYHNLLVANVKDADKMVAAVVLN
jgi:DNA-binding winged helix-turn-helix (wHTH) protein